MGRGNVVFVGFGRMLLNFCLLFLSNCVLFRNFVREFAAY